MNEFLLEELVTDMHPISPMLFFPSNDDVLNLSKRLTHLEVEINTQKHSAWNWEDEKAKIKEINKAVKEQSPNNEADYNPA